MTKNLIALGAACLALAVLLGAFGAHALRDVLNDHTREIYQTGIAYQFRQAFGILIIALLEQNKIISQKAALIVSGLLLIGIILFCGSLYALAITGITFFGIFTPLGGILFIVAWVIVAIAALRKSEIV